MVGEKPSDTALQDGMLAYYLEQAKLADANVEARIEREPFDYRDSGEAGIGRRHQEGAAKSVNRGP
ncbi:MAG: hypothetical protein WBF43_12135 [Methylocella sp.]